VTRFVFCLSLALLTGCGANDGVAQPEDCPDGRSYSVEEAVEQRPTGVIQVEGFIVSQDGHTRLCSALLESYPPQCGAPSLHLPAAPLQGDATKSADGTTWTEDERRILGSLTGDTLRSVGCA
jgi:hypothetical protein